MKENWDEREQREEIEETKRKTDRRIEELGCQIDEEEIRKERGWNQWEIEELE